MTGVKVRLLFHSSLARSDKAAACAGADTFRRFGVMCDFADVGNGRNKSVNEVRAGRAIANIVNTAGLVVLPGDFVGPLPLWYALFSRGIFGLGITPNVLFREGAKKFESATGLSITGKGVLSLYNIINGPSELREGAVTIAVRRELGYVFGVGSSCTDERCIMQVNMDYADFVRKIVTPALEFCRNCQGKIVTAIARASRT